MLITVGDGAASEETEDWNMPPVRLDSDHPTPVRQFLDHWQPDLCLWTGGDWMPNLISEASARNTTMILADLLAEDLVFRRRWMPDLTRSCLDHFETVFLGDETAIPQMRKYGYPARRYSLQSRLYSDAPLPPCAPSDLNETAAELGGRPVWLAAELTNEEFMPILTAHCEALQLQHRLLLVVIRDPSEKIESTLGPRLESSGIRYCFWAPGDSIPEHVQALVCDPEDIGLWYRLAPQTFLGGSLVPGKGGHAPLTAAALGSAVLFGPYVENHTDAYTRLADAGGACPVHSVSALTTMVMQLASPDRAAAMALAGWQVVTEGAELIDTLIDLIQDRLDDRELMHARA